jgi:hypothetical protein
MVHKRYCEKTERSNKKGIRSNHLRGLRRDVHLGLGVREARGIRANSFAIIMVCLMPTQ